MSPVIVRVPTPTDLDEVKAWLIAENAETDAGFYCNWNVIEGGLEHDDTFVMMRDHEAVAVLVDGLTGPSIMSVRPDLRGQGIGGQFARWLFERAMGRGYSVLEIECEPRTSVPFWRKHGFLPMAAGPDGFRRAFRLLERQHTLLEGAGVRVVIGLFPPERNWAPSTAPYWVRAEQGRRNDGGVQLPVRVALYQPGESCLADCVVRVTVDEDCVYEDKLKRPETLERGIVRDPGGFYYVDVLRVACSDDPGPSPTGADAR